MSVTKSQRIGIWAIAILMAVGTMGSFLAIILANKNQQGDQAQLQSMMAQYQKDTEAHQTKVDAQAAELSKRYFDTFNQFASRPVAFDATSVTELGKNDLVVGEGDVLTGESSFTAYYIGWNPAGKVFDGSINGNSLKAPLTVKPGSVIKGWTDGVVGMKVGGVRELSIPAELAYGAQGSGADIPANTPIKFIVMTIETPAAIPAPIPSQKLLDLYRRSGQQ